MSITKLAVVVLLSTLTLGLSSVAVAKDNIKIITNWLYAKKKVDCPTTCGATLSMKIPMVSGINREKGKKPKPISICATQKDRKGPWFTGYNLWEENTCTVGIGGKEYHGERYYCLCSTRGIQPLR